MNVIDHHEKVTNVERVKFLEKAKKPTGVELWKLGINRLEYYFQGNNETPSSVRARNKNRMESSLSH